MSKFELLNSVDHKDCLVDFKLNEKYQDCKVSFTKVVPIEFRHVAAIYPIVLIKDKESGAFNFVALFGFDPGENLFLEDDRWNARYQPLNIKRGPFFISGDATSEEPKMLLDVESDRISATGVPIFKEFGGMSEELQERASILRALFEGEAMSNSLTAKLAEYDLIEKLDIDATLNNGESKRFTGMYTINDEKLAGLPAEAVQEFHKLGLLEAVYAVILSQGQLGSLIDKVNAKIA